MAKEKQYGVKVDDLPDGAPLTENDTFNMALNAIRTFELTQMSYGINYCKICHERDIEMNMFNTEICKRCSLDTKNKVKMYSDENNMNPGKVPPELADLSMIEEQLICKISPCINVHMLKHGGIGSSGHCVTFPQAINEPSQIFPRLPSEINVIKVRRQGRNDSSKQFLVRRIKVQRALEWLKMNNPAYHDITISIARLEMLPENGELHDICTVTCSETSCGNDRGPAPNQTDPGDIDGDTASGILLNDPPRDIRQEVEDIVSDVVGEDHGEVTINRLKHITIPWPTRDNTPLSEFTTRNFFTLAFPTLFPYASGDFHVNRPVTCPSMADWARHLMLYDDGRFARHPYFKFVAHNIISRRRAIDNSNFVITQKIGDAHITVEELRKQLESGDINIANRILFFLCFTTWYRAVLGTKSQRIEGISSVQNTSR